MSANAKRERAARRRQRRRKRSRRRRARSLRALTSSALALPGLAGSAVAPVIARAEGLSDRVRADYAFSYYVEDDVPGDKLASGSSERYEVLMHQFHLAAPATDRLDLGLDVSHETMSGATPWFVQPGTDGPVQVMTGATIEDARTDALLTGTYHFDPASVKGSAGVSAEKDYLAFNGNLGGDFYFNEKNTTLSGGGSFSIDRIEPTEGGEVEFRPELEHKWSLGLHGGISQVFGEHTVLQTNFVYRHSNGFLSDPYKRALVAGNPIGDSRPDTRNQFSWLSRLRQHVPFLDAALHTDYRFYADDWEMTSHTLDVAWHQNFFDWFRLIPSFRYYSQSQAGFYAPYYDQARSDGLASSDYRLSPYGAISFRVRAETEIPTGPLVWRPVVSYERYTSGADLALGTVDVENPGLVSFHMISVSLTGRF